MIEAADLTPAQITESWRTFDCDYASCQQTVNHRCRTASGALAAVHANRRVKMAAYLSRQPEVDALNALVTSLRAREDQLTATLQASDEKTDALAGQVAQLLAENDELATELANERTEFDAYKKAHPDTPAPTPTPDKPRLLIGAGGGNSDRTKQKIDIDRRYYGGADSDIAKFVTAAKANHAAGILTWPTFKLPVSWADALTGKADAWFDKIATASRALGFEVWLDFHHEPEGDGDAKTWAAFNLRFAKRLGDGKTGPVKYILCVTGYSEEYGAAGSAGTWDQLWPKGAEEYVYAIAYDNPYLRYGVPLAGGALDKTWSEGADSYVKKLAARARSLGVKAAVGEFGYSDEAFAKDPAWIDRTLQAMAAEDVYVGVCYFDSILNSTRSWPLGTGAKRARFEAAAASVRTTTTT